MSTENDARPLLEVDDLAVTFELAARSWRWKPQVLRAVDGVSFELRRGDSFALVGESGSGKTTTGRALLGLYRPARGSVRFDGAEVSKLKGAELKRFRSRAQMIFQDPYASLNPRMKVGAIIAEPLRAHGAGSARQRRDRVQEMLELVGLPPDASNRFPYAFSGGQRQRVGIARALALAPDFVVADEPVSALDVSVQAQILNLLADLREELSLTMLFIAHNLAVVRHIATRVAVMYLGQLVEIGSRDEVFSSPAHPYTRALLRAVPPPDPGADWSGGKVSLRGDIPSPVSPPSGCRFHTRCPYAAEICRTEVPEMRTFMSGRKVACHFAVEGRAGEFASRVAVGEAPDERSHGGVENRGILS
ncbi:MAG TPA: oligopeptide/dipeptide ABC transporter ATP-binding protein [Solirubrobacteraceae bacterium]|nr:oligopeptide/dipeptide ABC transporter ATP-binding protein [Solirubrobacteraceae bacterium]